MIRHRSNLKNVLNALDEAEERTLTAIGELVRSEAQVRSPVKTGAYRDSHDYIVDMEEQQVLIGNDMEYAIWLELGSSYQNAQMVISKAVYDNVAKIRKLIKEVMRL